MKGATLGPVGEDITWPDQVAPRGRKASSTRNLKRQNLKTESRIHKCIRCRIFSPICALSSLHFMQIYVP